jgi:hypothetical protein
MFKRILVALAITLSACSSIDPTPTDSGVEGQIFIGPMCPVEQEGQECPDQPYQATLTVNSTDGGKIVQVQTDENGKFRIPLAPGEYILHPESPSVMPFASDQSFIVEVGIYTEIIVNYDSGIR